MSRPSNLGERLARVEEQVKGIKRRIIDVTERATTLRKTYAETSDEQTEEALREKIEGIKPPAA